MKRLLALTLLSTLVASGSPANAGPITISFADTFGPHDVPFPAESLVTLSQFDPALGTLTKVTLTLDAEAFGGTIAWDNEAAESSDVMLGIGAEVTADGLAGLTAVAFPLQLGSGSVDADNDGAADFIGTDSFSVIDGSGSDSGMGMLTAGLAPYIGPGTFDVEVSAAVETFLSTTDGFGPIDPVPGMTSGTVTVTYEYVPPVPEPSSLALLVTGAVGLIAYGRRKRKMVASRHQTVK